MILSDMSTYSGVEQNGSEQDELEQYPHGVLYDLVLTEEEHDDGQRYADHNEQDLDDEHGVAQEHVVAATIPQHVGANAGRVGIGGRRRRRRVAGREAAESGGGRGRLVDGQIGATAVGAQARKAVEVVRVRVVLHALHEPVLVLERLALVGGQRAV